MNNYSEAELYYKLDNMVLSSSQYLRNVFKSRWKLQTGEYWTDSSAQKEKLLSSLIPLDSKNKKCPLQAFQQKSLKEKDVGDWDISLLSAILLLQRSDNEKIFVAENEAIRMLKNIRNALAHDDTGSSVSDEEQCFRKCSLEEFQKHAKSSKDCLKCLGVDEITIDKIIEKSGVTSSLKALQRAKKLYNVAENLMRNDQFDQAIDHYTDAIGTPSLLPEHKAEAYEKRAACYLKCTNRMDAFCDEAFNDATKALKLNENSWKAHHVCAQCYIHKNNFTKAIQHYQKALAISPVQTNVKRDLESCQILEGIFIENDDVDPVQLPGSLYEEMEEFEKETGRKLTEEEFTAQMLKLGSVIKGHDQVFLGHQYYNGWSVLQNYNQAIKHYAKADEMGNPIGTFNLGLCYAYGKGAEQNLQKALKIFKRAATMDPKFLGQQTPLQRNFGVAASQHAIARFYQKGLGVDQNYYKAFIWFQKGMDNGFSPSAEYIGLLYCLGFGVKTNEIMAEYCWKAALNWGNKRAAERLMSFYISQKEPEMGLNMLKIGKEMGSKTLLSLPDKKLSIVCEALKQKRDEILPQIVHHEEKYNLSAKGWLFQQRFLRFISFQTPEIFKANQILTQSMKAFRYGESGGYGRKKIIPQEAVQIVLERALNGSEIATKILLAVNYWNELQHKFFPIRELSADEKMRMVEILYKSTILQVHLNFHLDLDEGMENLGKFVQKLFEQQCEQAGDLDMKIRLCHVIYNLQGSWRSPTDQFALEVLKEGVRRYPENVTYYDYLSLSYSFKRNTDQAIYWADEGLKKFPKDVSLLYNLGMHLMYCSKYHEAIKAFHDFLEAAPKDHVMVPEAYYRTSLMYKFLMNTESKEEKIENHQMVEAYYKLGQTAEKDRLPCYISSEVSEHKTLVECYLGSSKELQNSKIPANIECLAKTKTNISPQEIGVLEKKPYLQSPLRIGLITFHRKMQNDYIVHQNRLKSGSNVALDIPLTFQPKLQQFSPAKLSGIVPITLKEMNPAEDCVYENTFLELSIIEEPHILFASINCVAEDNNGDTTDLFVYNVEKNPSNLDKFQPGCKLAILNPYMRIGKVARANGIRNDEPDCIIYLKKKEDVCRFCADENATRKCSKCKRLYCSRECQKLDWRMLEHKIICTTTKLI